MGNIVIILQLIPALITALKAIEDAIPGSGMGEQKLAAVRAMLEVIDGSISKLWPQISGVIGVLVGLFNAVGVFKKA
jgi:phage-related minor tail protein